jgi:hypothetical protein
MANEPQEHAKVDPTTRGAGAGGADGDRKYEKNQEQSDERKRQQEDRKHRGAGSGENANATRRRNPKDEEQQDFKPGDFGDYAEGDPDAGRIDPEEKADCITLDQIAMRDRRAYLIQQAERNERANDELNAIQVEQNKRVQFAQTLNEDPDVQRERSMENAIAQLERHDPEQVLATRDERRKLREKARSRGRGRASESTSEKGPPPSAEIEHHGTSKQQVKTASGDGK